MTTCENCGCKVYGGYCTNCNEEHFIEEQYIELGDEVPKTIYDKAREDDKEAKRRNEEDRLKDLK